MTTILAMAILPLALITSTKPDDVFDFGSTKYRSYISWSQRLLLAFYVTRTINTYLAYYQVGLSQLSNFLAQELWSAPCKCPTAYPYSPLACKHSLSNSWVLSKLDHQLPFSILASNVGELNALTSLKRRRLSLYPLPPTMSYRHPSFIASGTVASPLKERSRSKHAPLLSRLLAPDILLHSVHVIYASVPLFQRLVPPSWHSAHPSSLQFPFPGLLLKCFILVWAVSAPVRYMLSAPDAPEWAELVKEGEDGVMRPLREWRWGRDGKRGGIGVPWLIMTMCEFTIIWACWIG